MTTKNEEIQKKINVALVRAETLADELAEVDAKLAPLLQRRDKLSAEVKYLQARVEKLTKMLAAE